MSNLVEVGKTNELENGAMKEVLTEGREILLARVGDDYYAADNRCPHMRGKLSRGKLEGTIVTCPVHGSQFDLKSGEVFRWLKGSGLLSKIGKVLKSPQPLKTYNVTVTGDSILVEI
ncbi:Biphenyl 2,3-dioxygenase, ferredoxin component [subsurface metagenome]